MKANGQPTQGIEPGDIGSALKFVIPVEELRLILKNTDIVNCLRQLVNDDSALEDLIVSVIADEQNGVDKDNEHSDWKHWLRQELEQSIAQTLEQSQADLPDPARTPFVLEYHVFKGIETPMGNIKIFQRLTRLCVGKSKISDTMADVGLSMYTDKLADDHPELAEFLRGQKRASSSSDIVAKRVRKDDDIDDIDTGQIRSAVANNAGPLRCAQAQFLSTMKVNFCGWMEQSLTGFFSTQTNFFKILKDVMQGAKQRMQEMIAQLTLLKVAKELMPTLTPCVYDHVKNAYGKRAKVYRMFLHSQGEGPLKPLLWTNTPNGGQQYVYLESEKRILERAWTGTHFGHTPRRDHSCAEMARTRLDQLIAAGLPLGEWTSDTCTLLLPNLSGPENE